MGPVSVKDEGFRRGSLLLPLSSNIHPRPLILSHSPLSHQIVITSTATGETLPFPFNNWVDKEHGLEHVIWPDRDGDGLGDIDARLGGMVKYRVNVYTSEIR